MFDLKCLFHLDKLEDVDKTLLNDSEKDTTNKVVKALYETHHEYFVVFRDVFIPTIYTAIESNEVDDDDISLDDLCEIVKKVPFQTAAEFYEHALQLNEKDQRKVVESIVGLSYEMKGIFLSSMIEEDYSKFQFVIASNQSADFLTAAKYAYYLVAVNNFFNNLSKCKQEDLESSILAKRIMNLLYRKVPELYELCNDENYKCSDDHVDEILTKTYTILIGFLEQIVDFLLDTLPSFKRDTMLAKFDKESYRIFHASDADWIDEDVIQLLVSDESSIFIETMETSKKSINENEVGNINSTNGSSYEYNDYPDLMLEAFYNRKDIIKFFLENIKGCSSSTIYEHFYTLIYTRLLKDPLQGRNMVIYEYLKGHGFDVSQKQIKSFNKSIHDKIYSKKVPDAEIKGLYERFSQID